MSHYIGNGDFEDRFDFYKWSAPFYETPKEVVRCVTSLKLSGKILKHINVIGCAKDTDYTDRILYRRLKEAGLEPEYDENDDNWYDWYENYPHKDKMLVPWSAEFCEPIQFVFEDDTTFEIMPTGSGGARIGVNTIPTAISNGLNRSDFDADIFFKEIIGKPIRAFSAYVTETDRQHIEACSLDKENPYTDKRWEYSFEIAFAYSHTMTLRQKDRGWYRAELEGSGDDGKVPYARVRAARKNQTDEQVVMVNGRGSGDTFWIIPINLDDNAERGNYLESCYGISISLNDVSEFLKEFLRTFFEEDIQEREDGERVVFDRYGGNLYTFESIGGMLREIRAACWLLENDYDNPVLAGIKSHFSWEPYTDKRRNELTESEINELNKNRVPVAIDFYTRFCSRMESMMLLPDKNAITFAGP